MGFTVVDKLGQNQDCPHNPKLSPLQCKSHGKGLQPVARTDRTQPAPVLLCLSPEDSHPKLNRTRRCPKRDLAPCSSLRPTAHLFADSGQHLKEFTLVAAPFTIAKR